MKFLPFLLLLFSTWQSHANVQWNESLSAEKITVYSRSQPSSDFAEFKGIVTINTSVDQAVRLITNTQASSAWLEHCASTTLIKQTEPNQALVYTVIDTPWPLNDRDSVVQFTFDQDQSDGSMHIRMQGLPNYLPEQDNKIRIPKLTGSWHLKPITANKVQVTYELSLEPGGNSPAWLVNEFSLQGMYNTLTNLRNLLNQPNLDAAMKYAAYY